MAKKTLKAALEDVKQHFIAEMFKHYLSANIADNKTPFTVDQLKKALEDLN